MLPGPADGNRVAVRRCKQGSPNRTELVDVVSGTVLATYDNAAPVDGMAPTLASIDSTENSPIQVKAIIIVPNGFKKRLETLIRTRYKTMNGDERSPVFQTSQVISSTSNAN